MSVIVLLDGSPETSAACSFAIALAQTTNRNLIAQAVIDRNAVMSLTGYSGYAGLCGSGVFLEAYHGIVKTLSELNESLLMSLTARAEGYGVKVNSHIDVGGVQEMLAARLEQQDSILVLADSDWSARMVDLLRFDGPAILVAAEQGIARKITIIANDSWTTRLQTIMASYLPAVSSNSQQPSLTSMAA